MHRRHIANFSDLCLQVYTCEHKRKSTGGAREDDGRGKKGFQISFQSVSSFDKASPTPRISTGEGYVVISKFNVENVVLCFISIKRTTSLFNKSLIFMKPISSFSFKGSQRMESFTTGDIFRNTLFDE